MILDSTFLIDVLRGREEVTDRVEELDASGAPAVSSVTVMELWEGIQLADASESERRAVENLLTDIDEFAFDRDCAMTAGRINAELVQAGTPVDTTDVMIAATGLVYDRPVVTRNVSDFERVPDLEVVSY
ncbi:PIN domain-containing protein [Natronomonas salina]|uniref:PIN domain-containing protein n=1 Tax=Natronomonas salina TaxID=1710540 RepID=UPI0015B52B45|nr:PIN domain-containing protein [Natronomonas salina]QLD88727.1 PIN domain-containing protein [Natronomonas salina]